jgi:hypothetical protein
MGAVIYIQHLLRWPGVGVVPGRKRGFFLRVVGRVRVGVILGVVFVLFPVSIPVRTCRRSRVGLVIMRCRVGFASWCHNFITIVSP